MIKYQKSEQNFRQYLNNISQSNSQATITDKINQPFSIIQESNQEENVVQEQMSYSYYQVKQLLMQEHGLSVELPLKSTFTKQDIELILEQYQPKKQEVEQQRYELPKKLFQERLQKKFYFDAFQILQIQFSDNDPLHYMIDIFEYLNFNKNKALNQNCKYSLDVKDLFKENAITDDYWHRKLYQTNSRKNILKQFQVQYPSYIYNAKVEKSFEWIRNPQNNQTRIFALSICIFQFSSKSIQAPPELQKIIKVIENIWICTNEDKGDREFYQNAGYNYLGFSNPRNLDYDFTKDIQNIKTDVLNIENSNNRQLMYKQNLNSIIEMCKDIKYQDKYIQLIINFFGMDDEQFQDYLIKEDNKLHFYDRLILSLMYCDNDRLKQFMNKLKPLDSLIIYGVQDQRSIECMKKYLDETQDIQLIGILSAHFYLQGRQDNQLLQWFQDYRNYLNNEQLYEQRMIIEQQIKEYQAKPEINLLKKLDEYYNKSSYIIQTCQCTQEANPQCLSCFTIYPKCSICYNPIQNQQYLLCLSCKHGGHEKHIQEWFNIYDQCPYKTCQCFCKFQ